MITDPIPEWATLPEPQNDPYVTLKRSRDIKNFHVCERELFDFVIGRWEVNYHPKRGKENKRKYMTSKPDAFYCHVNKECLKKHRADITSQMDDIRVSKDCV